MVPKRHVLTGVLLVVIIAGLGGLLMFHWDGRSIASSQGNDTQSEASLIQLAKPLRPAAVGESPEASQLKSQPPRVNPETLPPPSKAELLDACAKQPSCRKKLEGAQKGQKPSSPLPAATTESPEASQFKKQPPPLGPGPALAPRSEHLSHTDSSLLSWLTPFLPAVAQAQTGFSVTLTPKNSATSTPFAALYFGGVTLWPIGFVSLDWNKFGCGPCTYSENKPYVHLYVKVPSTGWYIINIRADKSIAKLRHLNNGPIIETWDFTGAATPCETCDYATMEYLAAGYQWFYFWALPSSFYTPFVQQVSMQSYP